MLIVKTPLESCRWGRREIFLYNSLSVLKKAYFNSESSFLFLQLERLRVVRIMQKSAVFFENRICKLGSLLFKESFVYLILVLNILP